MALLGGERTLLGRRQRLGELGRLLGAPLVFGVVGGGGAQGSELALDPRIFRLEPGQAAPFLGRRRPERVAACVEVGRGGLGFHQIGLGGGELSLRVLLAVARFRGQGAGVLERLGESGVLGGEPLDDGSGVGDQRLLALEVAGELGGAPLELGLAVFGPLLLGLERVAGQCDAMQRRAAAGLLLAQGRQVGGGERLQAGGLALGAGALGDVDAGPSRASSRASAKAASCSRQAIRWARASWRRMSAARLR